MDHEPKPGTPSDDHLRSEFEAFVKDNLGFLLPVARRYAGLRGLPASAAVDLVQEALCIAWDAWPATLNSADRGRRRAFVRTAMSNVACDHQLSRRRASRGHRPFRAGHAGGTTGESRG